MNRVSLSVGARTKQSTKTRITAEVFGMDFTRFVTECGHLTIISLFSAIISPLLASPVEQAAKILILPPRCRDETRILPGRIFSLD